MYFDVFSTLLFADTENATKSQLIYYGFSIAIKLQINMYVAQKQQITVN